MIILDSTLKKLQAFTAATPSAVLTYYISYVDINQSTLAVSAVSAVDGTFNQSATDILAAPSAGYSRQIKSINIYNPSNGTQIVSIAVNNNGTQRIINKIDVNTFGILAYENGQWTESLTAVIGSDLITLTARSSNPSPPGAGTMLLYDLPAGGRQLPRIIGPSGLDTSLQPALFGNGIILLAPNTTTTMFAMGTVAPTFVGTLSTPALSANTLRESTRRSQLLSAATGGSASEARIAFASVWRGNGAGLGGFFFRARFAYASNVATQRLLVGLTSATTAISVTIDPSTLTNCVFLGNDAGDSNLQIMHNDASGTCTKVDLGGTFVKNELNAIYDITFFAAPNDNDIGYTITKLNTGDTASGTLASDLPAAATFLAPHIYLNNGGTASAVTIDIMRLYIETDQ